MPVISNKKKINPEEFHKLHPEIYWLSNNDYNKAKGQLQMQFTGILSVFDTQGLGIFIPEVVKALTAAAEDFSLRCRGVDKEIKNGNFGRAKSQEDILKMR